MRCIDQFGKTDRRRRSGSAITTVAATATAITTTTAAITATAATAIAAATTTLAATATTTITPTTTTTTAVAATRAATATTTAAATHAATASLIACFVDDQAAAVEGVAVHGLDRILGSAIVAHRDETEASRAASFAVSNDLGLDDVTVCSEHFEELCIGGPPRQIADVDLC